MASSSKELDLGGLILQVLEEKGQLDSYDFSRETGREHQTVVGAIKSLQSVGNVSNRTGLWLGSSVGCCAGGEHRAEAV